jgi:hypothetical protein
VDGLADTADVDEPGREVRESVVRLRFSDRHSGIVERE